MRWEEEGRRNRGRWEEGVDQRMGEEESIIYNNNNSNV
jgi:hypothetical protein